MSDDDKLFFAICIAVIAACAVISTVVFNLVSSWLDFQLAGCLPS